MSNRVKRGNAGARTIKSRCQSPHCRKSDSQSRKTPRTRSGRKEINFPRGDCSLIETLLNVSKQSVGMGKCRVSTCDGQHIYSPGKAYAAAGRCRFNTQDQKI